MPDPAQLLPLAHAGHWLVWILYAVPIVAVVVAIWLSSRRGKAALRGGGGDDPTDLGR